MVVLTFALLVAGIRLGVGLIDKPRQAAAKVSPMVTITTQEPFAGLVIDVTAAEPLQVESFLDVLENLSLKATWFMTATFVEANGDLACQVAEKGHEFGVKGTDEKAMHKLGDIEITDRLTRSRQALSKLSIEPVPFLLPPGGKISDALLQVAFVEGFHGIKPGVDAGSMRGKAEDAGKKLAARIKPGDMVLVRVDKKGPKPGAEYLQALVSSLQDQGISLVTLSDLLKSVR